MSIAPALCSQTLASVYLLIPHIPSDSPPWNGLLRLKMPLSPSTGYSCGRYESLLFKSMAEKIFSFSVMIPLSVPDRLPSRKSQNPDLRTELLPPGSWTEIQRSARSTSYICSSRIRFTGFLLGTPSGSGAKSVYL